MINKINLPNKLTLIRIVLTPILLLLMIFKYEASTLTVSKVLLHILVVLLFASIALTDFFDGYIARRDNLVTNFGKLLDPIADKVFVFSVLIVLVKYNMLSIWMVIILLAREFVVVAIRMLILENGGEVVAASSSAKLKTATQMIALLFALLFPFGKVINSLVLLPAVVFSIISMLEYYNLVKKYIGEDM
ncbi:CDP-diacylglycerol--glycerol-3-phosphate 3-phosphatidyltransferase [Streptobacillus felis]|uniref:CDP-diacylglycerol--glycerol-3-phosphate 3-phosphatidyltransferase n=1 Tax=Streptobacillus felis TaxID=1384509 RepID=A0A7Z0PGE2_9FUSO|nr:CDP-diacylglycerol--glycerol-3-phosphate 3-phosphatidyltransferase [Streptobacillus felis]NYV27580.1 CDP-diacylglycerol--glycerol-3-phosphate 3-phosphatidyltransferase [Streptobacillus felis]